MDSPSNSSSSIPASTSVNEEMNTDSDSDSDWESIDSSDGESDLDLDEEEQNDLKIAQGKFNKSVSKSAQAQKHFLKRNDRTTPSPTNLTALEGFETSNPLTHKIPSTAKITEELGLAEFNKYSKFCASRDKEYKNYKFYVAVGVPTKFLKALTEEESTGIKELQMDFDVDDLPSLKRRVQLLVCNKDQLQLGPLQYYPGSVNQHTLQVCSGVLTKGGSLTKMHENQMQIFILYKEILDSEDRSFNQAVAYAAEGESKLLGFIRRYHTDESVCTDFEITETTTANIALYLPNWSEKWNEISDKARNKNDHPILDILADNRSEKHTGLPQITNLFVDPDQVEHVAAWDCCLDKSCWN